MSDKIERVIDALRKKILEEAIRGNLVPQNPEDEPASVLLQRIEAERERLIKEKKIKRPKSVSKIFRRDGHFYESINGGEPTCIDDDIPFEIPDSWEWCRLESICEVNPRNKLNEELLAGFIPMASVREGFSNYHDVNTKQWGEIKSGYTHLRNNDVMVAKITPCFQNRKSAIVDNLPNGYGAGSTEFHIARTFDEKIIPSFLLVLFKSEYFIQKGLATFTGTAGQQRISSDFFSSFLIALPPTNEQFRLVRAVQNRLQALNDIEKSRKRYKYILSETPTSLRQQLIQSAIQGQLVPQNPNDEPASVLLERIAQERTAKLGKKAAKSMSRIVRRGSKTYVEVLSDKSEKDISMEIPFEIPDNWEWVRLGDIGVWGSGATPNRREHAYYNGNIPWLKTGDLTDGYITDIPERISELALNKTSVKLNPAGSVLMAMYGATIGKLGILTYPATTNQACCACTPYFGVNNHFLFYYLLSQRNLFIKKGEGGAQPNISKEKITHTLFPLPPVNEQIIICKKLKRLLELLSN